MAFKRASPHLEDNDRTAGGDGTPLRKALGRAIDISVSARPPGENPKTGTRRRVLGPPSEAGNKPFDPDGRDKLPTDEPSIENAAAAAGLPEEDVEDIPYDFLDLLQQAEDQANLYIAQVNRTAWTQSLRAFHNQHYIGSRYTNKDWRNRSRLFVPKTRAAVKKDMASVAASMFGSINAVNCDPGDESDPRQRAASSVMEELINYRTSRASSKASIPWFQVAMGARQDSLLTGVCLSKQSWKLEVKNETVMETTDETGKTSRQVKYSIDIDRPDSQLIPGENYIIDPAADWTNPVQSAAYVIIKWPMRIDEIQKKQKSPINPWLPVSEETLRSAAESTKFESAAIRRARENDIDRMDQAQNGTRDFQVIWVYETFMRIAGEDWTFLSVDNRHYLSDPKLVEDVYPEQHGERPLTLGYGALEAHRIFPMAPVESWQPLQHEINDIRNLTLDALKQNVMPVTKIKRGRQIDIDQVKRRSSGSSIVVSDKDDVTWERPPDLPQSIPLMMRDLELEFDDLAGQFNGGTTENNNALSRTLGGLKLVAGAANAVQEFDIRIWIETWAEPTLTQIVRLEQYYEEDQIVLGLCGQRAELFDKFGVSQINDDLLEQDVTVRVSVGLGAGDPQQRLQKFSAAVSIALPLLQQSREFVQGEKEMNWETVMEEIFGAAGYRDGGKRFIKDGQPQQDQNADLMAKKIMSEIAKNEATGKSSMLQALAAIAKVALGDKTLEATTADTIVGRQLEALGLGVDHAHRHMEQHMGAMDKGHGHGLALRQHQDQRADAQRQQDQDEISASGQEYAETQEMKAATAPAAKGKKAAAAPAPAPQPAPAAAAAPPAVPSVPPRRRVVHFIYGKNGRITGAEIIDDDVSGGNNGNGGGETPPFAGERGKPNLKVVKPPTPPTRPPALPPPEAAGPRPRPGRDVPLPPMAATR